MYSSARCCSQLLLTIEKKEKKTSKFEHILTLRCCLTTLKFLTEFQLGNYNWKTSVLISHIPKICKGQALYPTGESFLLKI